MEMVGSGAQGMLYAAREVPSGRKVAVKLQKPREFESEGWYASIGDELDHEASVAGRLSEISGIPRLIDRGTFQNRRCVVMEFVEGELLHDVMLSTRPVRLAAAASAIAQLCEILHKVHEAGLVHRDVKPENVMVEPDGRVRLLDLGLAVEAGSHIELPRGTTGYTPLEQFGPGALTPRADVFALGCIFLEMIVMRLPYAGMVERPRPGCPVLPAEDLRLVPERIRPLALAMVDQRIERRPAGTREVFHALRPLLPPFGSEPPKKRRRPDLTEYYRTHHATL
nr:MULTISPECIES: serine/threonine-protein kinase [unclassified Streptomyces]